MLISPLSLFKTYKILIILMLIWLHENKIEKKEVFYEKTFDYYHNVEIDKYSDV